MTSQNKWEKEPTYLDEKIGEVPRNADQGLERGCPENCVSGHSYT